MADEANRTAFLEIQGRMIETTGKLKQEKQTSFSSVTVGSAPEVKELKQEEIQG